VLGDLGLPPVSRAFIARTVGKGSEHLIHRMLAEVGAPDALFDAAWARYQHHYLAINGVYANVYPGVIEGLRALKGSGLRLGLPDQQADELRRPLLAAKGSGRLLRASLRRRRFRAQEARSAAAVEDLRALGSEPARTLMIGDSSNDARAARAAGCAVVLVNYGYNHGEPIESAGADAVVGRLDDVPALLPTLLLPG